MWHQVGNIKPSKGTLLDAEDLGKALEIKQQFTKDELEKLGVKVGGFRLDHYIQVKTVHAINHSPVHWSGVSIQYKKIGKNNERIQWSSHSMLSQCRRR